MNPFYRLSPFIQEYIYAKGWTHLRAIQTAACHVIFETDDNLLLSASTASGKTEAAFFPILTLLDEDPPASVGALYIGPLKALINDQFLRLNDLCKEANIPVWHWHGDVNQSHKERLVKNPSGILQITPESLEALLMRRHNDIVRLFGDLRFIVIDEVHSLMRGDRGGQVLCLMERLARLSGANPRRIGLSATIGDLDTAGKWLAGGTNRKTSAPVIPNTNSTWRISMEHFYISDRNISISDRHAKLPKNTNSKNVSPTPIKIEPTVSLNPIDSAPNNTDLGLGYIFNHTEGKKCLVFCNSREECEAVTTTLRRYCDEKHIADRFLIHHGNLSASYRETAEDRMRDENSCLTTVTTATLELGIDIGRLERAFQIDAPFMVSSFLQRMGRTGRRDAPPEMWFVIREDELLHTATLPQTIPWKLLQGISLIQLYLEERWVEPPKLDRLPYSLLYHQTLATLASCGELNPADLARRVLTLTPFQNISQDDFRLLLYHLLENEHIERTETGGLIVGLKGERVVNSYKFYAVFREDELFTVRWQSRELGTIVMPPPVGERIALAGQVWVVTELDLKRRLIFAEPVKGQVPAFFGLCPGDIHTKVLERMKRLLFEDIVPKYLRPNAVSRLMEVREVIKNANCDCTLVHLGGDMWCLMPWLGTYAFLALERFLKLKCAGALGMTSIESSRPYFIQFKMKASRQEFIDTIHAIADEPLDPMELIYHGEIRLFEKYDEYVPEGLIRKGFAKGILDINTMLERLKELK